MKKIQKIIIALVAMFAFGLTANAQKIVVGDVNDFAACKLYLSENPRDTIESKFSEKVVMDDPGKFSKMGVAVGDTLLRDTIVFVREGKIVRQPRYTKYVVNSTQVEEVYDAETIDKIDRAAAATQTAEKLASGKKRDVLYYESSGAFATDGRVIKNSADKYGWGLNAEAGWRGGNDISAITASLGGSYSFSWGRADLQVRVARSRFTSNADHAGEHYTTYGGRLGGYIKLLSFDKFATWNLYLGGGIGWDFYKTDSRESETTGLLQSIGSDPYGYADLMVTKRFFATGWEVYGKLGWEQAPSVFQNSDTQYTNCVKLTLGVTLPVLRHWVKTTK